MLNILSTYPTFWLIIFLPIIGVCSSAIARPSELVVA